MHGTTPASHDPVGTPAVPVIAVVDARTGERHVNRAGDTSGWGVEATQSPWGQPVLVVRPGAAVGDVGPSRPAAPTAGPAPVLVLHHAAGTHRLTWEGRPETWDVTVVHAGGGAVHDQPTFVVRTQFLRGSTTDRTPADVEHALVPAACEAVRRWTVLPDGR